MIHLLLIGEGLVSSLIIFSLGILVLFSNTKDNLNKKFFLVSFFVSCWPLSAFLLSISNQISPYILASIYLFGLFSIISYFEFIELLLQKKSLKIFIEVLTVLNVLFVLSLPTAFLKSDIMLKNINPLMTNSFVFLFLLPNFACLYMIFNRLKNSYGKDKFYLRFILVAYGLIYISSIKYLGSILNTINFHVFSSYIILLSFSISFYAIARYKLIEINLLNAKDAIFIGTSSLNLFAPIAVVLFAKKHCFELFGSNWWIAPVLVAVVFAFVNNLIYWFMNNKERNIILKAHFNIYSQLLRISEKLLNFKDINNARKDILEIIESSLNLTHIRFFVLNQETGIYKPLILENEQTSSLKIEENNSIVKFLYRTNTDMLCNDFLSDDEIKKNMAYLESRVILANFVNGSLEGFISLGRKINDEPYNFYELNFLKVIINELNLIMENIRCNERIKEQEKTLVHNLKLKTLGEMASGVVHQINNPLMGIILTAGTARLKIEKTTKQISAIEKDFKEVDFLRSIRELNESAIKNLKIIEERASHAGNIVDNILRFSRPGDFRVVNIKKLVEDGLSLIPENKIKAQKVKIIKNIPDNLAKIRVKPWDMEQVVMNLSINAIEAMHGGGTLEITAKESLNNSDYIELVFEDTGCGISENNINKIFDFFFTTKGNKGTGLGLALASKMIESNFGKINVDSTVGEGTTFVVCIPVWKENKNPENTENKNLQVINN